MPHRSIAHRRPLRAHRRNSHSAQPVFEPLEPRLMLSADPVASAVWETDAGGNGHRYDVIVVDGGISWEDANAQAQAAGGHLVTLTSQAENEFVANLIDDPQFWHRLPVLGTQAHGPWIGATRPDGATGGPTDGWEWVTGETWDFTNWANNEPNNVSTERFAHFVARGQLTSDTWASFENDSSRFYIQSYIVEHDAEPQAPNQAPTIDSAPVTDGLETRTYTYEIAASDPDGDAVTISAEGLPDWLTLVDHGDGTATLSGTPGAQDLGEQPIRLIVSDGQTTTEQAFTIDITTIGQIDGRLFNDADRDGLFDEGESPLADWTVYVDTNNNGVLDDGEAVTTTNDQGRYSLTGIQPGEHGVRAIAPFDTAMLERFELRIRGCGKKMRLDLAENDRVRIERNDASTLLVNIETGRDGDFDDVVLKVTHDDTGRASVTVLERTGRGRMSLVDRDTGRVVMDQITRKDAKRGRTAALARGWRSTTADDLLQVVTTNEGQTLTDIDFALTNASHRSCGFVKARHKAIVVLGHFLGDLLDYRPGHQGHLMSPPAKLVDLLFGSARSKWR